jgi:hypothetical protein
MQPRRCNIGCLALCLFGPTTPSTVYRIVACACGRIADRRDSQSQRVGLISDEKLHLPSCTTRTLYSLRFHRGAMALTQVGSHLMPATVGQHFHHTHKKKEPRNELLCNCSWDYRASAAPGCSLKKMTLQGQKSSSSGLKSSTIGLKDSSSICTINTQVKTTRFRKQPSFARAAIAETDIDNASQKRGLAPEPKERVVEINPFEIPKASPLQTAASVALTSLIGVLLFRSARRRAQRATGVVRKSVPALRRLLKLAPGVCFSAAKCKEKRKHGTSSGIGSSQEQGMNALAVRKNDRLVR